MKIFVNCPYSPEYIPVAHSIIFCSYFFHLEPKFAVEETGYERLAIIMDLIKSCSYSLHDLSICKSEIPDERHRMNMPFEVGMSYFHQQDKKANKKKKIILLGSFEKDFFNAFSDVNGIGIEFYEKSEPKLFNCLFSSLSKLNHTEFANLPDNKIFEDAYKNFQLFYNIDPSSSHYNLFLDNINMKRYKFAVKEWIKNNISSIQPTLV